jgi:HemY protein
MRQVLATLLLALLGALIVLSFYEDNGYVLIRYSPYTLETSLTFFLFVLVLALFAARLAWRLVSGTLLLPGSIREALRRARSRRARESLVRGLLRLAEGRWAAAESEIMRQAPQHEGSVVNYLYAARIAQHLGDVGRRDAHLRRAYSARPHAEVAVLLTQAELQMAQAQDTQALASLLRVIELEPGQARAQELLATLYERLGDWQALYALLLKGEKSEFIPAPEWQSLAVRAQQALLARAAQEGGIERIRDDWAALPRRLRRDTRMIRTQSRLLVGLGAHADAIRLVTAGLARGWDADLARLYSELEADDPVSQLAAVEAWLKQYGEEPALLFVAGRLCLRNKLWGRAKSYLDASFRADPRPETLLELGRVYEATREEAAAENAYRRGLELAVQGAATPAGEAQKPA